MQPDPRVSPSLKGRLRVELGAIGRHRTLLVMSVIAEFWHIGKSGSGRRGDAGNDRGSKSANNERILEGISRCTKDLPLTGYIFRCLLGAFAYAQYGGSEPYFERITLPHQYAL